jgi:hypothetical protein
VEWRALALRPPPKIITDLAPGLPCLIFKNKHKPKLNMRSSIKITHGGNRIHATGAAANALFKALTAPLIKNEAKHTHVNNGVNDNCKECGRDLRDPMHTRYEPNLTPPIADAK